jgi:hypothetical protein
VTLHLKSTTKAAKFEYADGRMTVSWDVDASLADNELVEELRRIVAFYDAQQSAQPLPQRTPGVALEMAQMTHPAPPANGWAGMAQPQVPEGADYELIPPEEQE